MSPAIKCFAVQDLSIGMYITSLDRPACQTPFPVGGFYIKSHDDLRKLSEYCKHVMVNLRRSDVVKQFKTTLEMEVADIPTAIAFPSEYRALQIKRGPRKVPKKQKGRVKRLFILLAFSTVVFTIAKHYLPIA